jgi:hypothetical protein
MGFYDKNNETKQVVLFKDVDVFNDNQKSELSYEINEALMERGSTIFTERDYIFLCDFLHKRNIPKEKRRELRNLFGANLRFGLLD